MQEQHKPPSSADSPGITRRDVFAGAAGLAMVGVTAAAAAAGPDDAHGRRALGANGAASGIELIARIDQLGDTLTAYGYLTLVAGLSLDQLYFPGVVRSEATARFTFHGTAKVASVQSHDTLIVAIANGHVDYFLRDAAGARFDTPLSFAQGERIAGDDAALQNVLNVTAPSTGANTVFGDLRRTASEGFRLDGARYQLGHVGLLSRLVAPGKSTRIEPVAPTSFLIVAGNITNPQ